MACRNKRGGWIVSLLCEILGSTNTARRGHVAEVFPKVELSASAARKVVQAGSAAKRAWAACLRKISEVDPVRCVKCGGAMKLVAVILDDRLGRTGSFDP